MRGRVRENEKFAIVFCSQWSSVHIHLIEKHVIALEQNNNFEAT